MPDQTLHMAAEAATTGLPEMRDLSFTHSGSSSESATSGFTAPPGPTAAPFTGPPQHASPPLRLRCMVTLICRSIWPAHRELRHQVVRILHRGTFPLQKNATQRCYEHLIGRYGQIATCYVYNTASYV